MAFGIALSGLAASQTNLDVTANNISNSETTGFKESRTEFAELFSSSLQGVSSLQSGNGVRTSRVAQQFTQGNLSTTSNSLDLAINGSGFFAVSDNGELQYTRAGAFSTDENGYVVNSSGDRLQVYPALDNGQFNTSTLSDLRLNSSQSAPNASTSVEMSYNLPANAEQPTSTTFDPSDANSYNNATSVTIYDSLGAAHTATMYYAKTANANEWQVYQYVDGTPVPAAVAPATTPAPQTMTYSSSGALVTPASGDVTFGTYTPTTGAAAMTVTYNMLDSTQYGNSFSVSSISQDGYTTGQLTGISVSASGVVQANFTNGQATSLGKVALVNFANEQGLKKLDGTSWAETFDSGQPISGEAGSSGYGQLQSGALEQSNVDITNELVNMIVAQRNYQANAQMISTEKSITETIINMAR